MKNDMRCLSKSAIDKKVLVFTGAGVSAESGISTFQDIPGIRDKLTREFANAYPNEYKAVISSMLDQVEKAEPNAAHLAIAESGFTVITMNIDKLHSKAGSKNVVELHGSLPTREQLEDEEFSLYYDNIVLYGDLAPRYADAVKLVKSLEYNNSYFIIIGTSFYTGISSQLYKIAQQRRAQIIIINDNATSRVPGIIGGILNKLRV